MSNTIIFREHVKTRVAELEGEITKINTRIESLKKDFKDTNYPSVKERIHGKIKKNRWHVKEANRMIELNRAFL